MLPKLQVPIYQLNLPSSGEIIKFRPFLMKEEKILLMAMEGNDITEITNSIIHILNNCITEPKLDINSLPVFDIEYLFLKIRSRSVGEFIKLQLNHPDDHNSKGEVCNHTTNFTLDLNHVEVEKKENHTNDIKLTENIGVKMKYPNIHVIDDISRDKDNLTIEDVMNIVKNCIDFIYDDQKVYKFSESTEEEIDEFMNSLNTEQYSNLQNFFETMPKLSYTIKFTCNGCNCPEEIVLEGLQNFFVLG